MTRRSRAREVALQLLFQRDLNKRIDRAVLERFVHDRLATKRWFPSVSRLYDGVDRARRATSIVA